MLYVGGLTFAQQMPETQLQIPNFVAAQRLIKAVFNRYQLRTSDIIGSLHKVASTGDVSALLACYQKMISMRDNFTQELRKSEESHRDSFYSALLGFPLLLEPKLEFSITKVRKNNLHRGLLPRPNDSLRIHSRQANLDGLTC
jgi:hypothetical protein